MTIFSLVLYCISSPEQYENQWIYYFAIHTFTLYMAEFKFCFRYTVFTGFNSKSKKLNVWKWNQ